MSGSLNKTMLIGNLGNDPEIRTIPDGSKVANFSIATSERFTDRSGQKVDKTEWHKIVMWRGLATIAEKYLRKGSNIYIEGKLATRSWDDKQGGKRYVTEIIVSELKMLGGGKRTDSQNQSIKEEETVQNENLNPGSEDDLPF